MSTTLLHNPDLIGSYMYKVRVPVGRLILELPAGMLDDDKGDFVGTAAREVSLSLSLSLSLAQNTRIRMCMRVCVSILLFFPVHVISVISVNLYYHPFTSFAKF
jgi:hypothetical protein